MAQSSFNIQPYKIILLLVKSNEMKSVIAEYSMLEDPTSLLQKLMKLEIDNGKNIGYINALPSTVGFLQSKGWLSTKIRTQSVTSLLSPLKAMPVIANPNSDSWPVKNTKFYCSSYFIWSVNMCNGRI